MSHSISTQDIREKLIRQLIILGEERNHFLDTYFLMHGKERTQMGQLLEFYTKFTENLLNLPHETMQSYVLIGSKTTITFLEDSYTDTFTIVFPEDTDPDVNRISFLSPFGKQLLFATLNDIVLIETPQGEQQVRIDNIEFELI